MLRRLTSLFSKRIPTRSLADDLPALEQERVTGVLAEQTIETSELLATYPPQIEHVKKRLLFDIALSNKIDGNVSVSRFRELTLPSNYQPYSHDTKVVAKKGYFRYAQTEDVTDWFMNFAHHNVFNGYGHFMFAQDEIQVAEHPTLASFRELMLARSGSLSPKTVESGAPTPILFQDIPRTINIDTRSIYGARFARSQDSTIRDAVRLNEPPSRSNILAIEAPISCGNKIYVRAEIELALRTAYSGFRAIVIASNSKSSVTIPVVLHTGNWGCGAYGGNRQLMLSIQMIAARLAGISKVIFYCGTDSKDDVAIFEAALPKRFKFSPGVKLERVIDRFVAASFKWGTPDGN